MKAKTKKVNSKKTVNAKAKADKAIVEKRGKDELQTTAKQRNTAKNVARDKAAAKKKGGKLTVEKVESGLSLFSWKVAVKVAKGEIDTRADVTWLHCLRYMRMDVLDAWNGLKIAKKTSKGWLLCNGVALHVSFDSKGVWTRQDSNGKAIYGSLADLKHVEGTELITDAEAVKRYRASKEKVKVLLKAEKREIEGVRLSRGEKGKQVYSALFVDLGKGKLACHCLEHRRCELNANHRFALISGKLD